MHSLKQHCATSQCVSVMGLTLSYYHLKVWLRVRTVYFVEFDL